MGWITIQISFTKELYYLLGLNQILLIGIKVSKLYNQIRTIKKMVMTETSQEGTYSKPWTVSIDFLDFIALNLTFLVW